MPDNIIETLQHLLQDVIAPDVRELKVRVASLEKQIDVRFSALDVRFEAIDQRFDGVKRRFIGVEQRFIGVERRFTLLEEKMDMQFKAVLFAISELKAQSELNTFRMISALSERVAVLESRSH